MPGSLVGDPAVTQEYHPVGPRGELCVVGDHNRGHPAVLARLVHQTHDRLGVARVERAGGLVGQQQPALSDHGAGDRHPLPFAARQLVWVALGPLGQP